MMKLRVDGMTLSQKAFGRECSRDCPAAGRACVYLVAMRASECETRVKNTCMSTYVHTANPHHLIKLNSY